MIILLLMGLIRSDDKSFGTELCRIPFGEGRGCLFGSGGGLSVESAGDEIVRC